MAFKNQPHRLVSAPWDREVFMQDLRPIKQRELEPLHSLSRQPTRNTVSVRQALGQALKAWLDWLCNIHTN